MCRAKLTLRLLETDLPIPPHNFCAMGWSNVSADACGHLAKRAGEIPAQDS
ncbi:hypothetical protein AB4099_12450 [Bosea sp. 2KB_26]|uniref:hypothetical protein n=1 Tax=Bosea sp. 2KB_26 TaxID=3237475 RepID=UPI003F8F039A